MKESGVNFGLSILIAVVISAIIAGGGTYYFTMKKLYSGTPEIDIQDSIPANDNQDLAGENTITNPPAVKNNSSTPSSAKKLNLETLKNITYTSDKGGETKLVNGKADTPITAGGKQDEYFIMLEESNYLIGDINGDGQNEAATILSERSGGTGFFKLFFIVSKSGDSYIGKFAGYLGDRVTITKSEIIAQDSAHGVLLSGTEWDSGNNTPISFFYNTSNKTLVQNPKIL